MDTVKNLSVRDYLPLSKVVVEGLDSDIPQGLKPFFL